jgi:hypothetical protein
MVVRVFKGNSVRERTCVPVPTTHADPDNIGSWWVYFGNCHASTEELASEYLND